MRPYWLRNGLLCCNAFIDSFFDVFMYPTYTRAILWILQAIGRTLHACVNYKNQNLLVIFHQWWWPHNINNNWRMFCSREFNLCIVLYRRCYSMSNVIYSVLSISFHTHIQYSNELYLRIRCFCTKSTSLLWYLIFVCITCIWPTQSPILFLYFKYFIACLHIDKNSVNLFRFQVT